MKKRFLRSIQVKALSLTSVVLLLALISGFRGDEEQSKNDEPINIILMIGDGMGLSQVSAGFFFQKRASNFERFPITGLIKTSSKSHKITDSAAGATAFACGEKTYNGAIGVDMKKKPVPNLVEILSKENFQTGVISTSSITHATPASFYAHVLARSMNELIAADLVKSEVDFFAGGGFEYFGKRKDSLDFIAELEGRGFQVNTERLFKKGEVSKGGKFGMLLADDGMPRMLEGRGDFLKNATKLSLQYFEQKERPFFLMVEGSQIDWGGHGNETDYLISEQIDFDKTIGFVLDYAEKHPNTLVIVTADHETGGFTLSSKQVPTEEGGTRSDYDEIEPTFSNGGHSATLVPVFAFGPGSEKFSGVYENTEVFRKVLEVNKIE